MKTPKGIVARISDADLDWMRDKIAHWRANGVTWFLVQWEIPAIGPNRGSGTSGLLLRNGDKVWRRFASMGVDHANDHRKTMTIHADGTTSDRTGRLEEWTG